MLIAEALAVSTLKAGLTRPGRYRSLFCISLVEVGA
jgi:hypothetical protein